MTVNVLRLCVRLRSVGIEWSGSLHKTAVSCCFFYLIFSKLQNNLKKIEKSLQLSK